MDLDEINLTQDEVNEYAEAIPSRGKITYSNTSFDIYGLVTRLNKGEILIPRIGKAGQLSEPDQIEANMFQRGFIWTNRQMDSFIESMLLGYPTPSLFFVSQSDGRMLVLDGQQRLETLRMYYGGMRRDRIYRISLDGSRYDGLSYSQLEPDSRRFLDNTPLSITVIRLEEKPNAVEAIYDVFSRLNGGGTKLTPHEIRMALYNGPLMDSLDVLNNFQPWRTLYGGKPNVRFRDHELVLRIIALYSDNENYKKPLGTFLNKYSGMHRNDGFKELENEFTLFKLAAEVYASLDIEKLFSTTSSKQINMAKADSLMVGAMLFASETGAFKKEDALRVLGKIEDDENYLESITEATSDEAKVEMRIASIIKWLKNE